MNPNHVQMVQIAALAGVVILFFAGVYATLTAIPTEGCRMLVSTPSVNGSEHGFWTWANNCTMLKTKCLEAPSEGLLCGWIENWSVCKCSVNTITPTTNLTFNGTV